MSSDEVFAGERAECARGGFMSTSLQKAAQSGDASLVAAALECSATNLDAVDATGRTALMIAAARGHLSVLRALCDAGADVDPLDGNGRDAVAIAEAEGHTACAELCRRRLQSARPFGTRSWVQSPQRTRSRRRKT
jgi:ankyrin repeat protein